MRDKKGEGIMNVLILQVVVIIVIVGAISLNYIPIQSSPIQGHAISSQASGRVFYIDWETGVDSNIGTSKSAPWKRHPYMNGFGGSYSHQAGDHFIFKGGVTWPRQAFQIHITAGGNSDSNRDYYGVDKTWYKGSSWSRPVFDFEDSQIGYGWNSGAGIWVDGVHYITFDNFEIKRFKGYLTGSDWGASIINLYTGVSYFTLENSYVHDWSIPYPGTTQDGGGSGAVVAVNGAGQGVKILNNTFHCANVINRTAGTLWLFGEVAYNDIYNVGSAFLGGGTLHHNHIHHLVATPDVAAHQNAILTFVPATIYNNVIHDTPLNAAVIFLDTTWAGTAGYDLVYNNVIFNINGMQGPIQVDTTRTIAAQSGSRIYNNIMHYNGWCVRAGERGNGPLGLLDVRNNYCITQTGSIACYNNPAGGCATVTNSVISSNIIMTPAQAASAGFTSSNNYAPFASSPLINQGVDLSSIFNYDLNNVPRQAGAWDIGAYEYVSGGTPAPINGACGPSLNTCSAGTLNDGADSATQYLWQCVGSGGGSTASCSQSKPAQTYTLTVSIVGLGTVSASGLSCSGTTCSGTYNAASAVTLSANAANGNTFYSWGGACSGSGSCIVTMDSSKAVTATFTTNTNNPSGLSFEAESGSIQSPFVVGNGYIYQTVQTTTDAGGRAAYSFNIISAGDYVVQAKVNAASTASDSFFVSIDSEPTIENVWHIGATEGFEYRNVSWGGSYYGGNPAKAFTLSAGSHNLIIKGREANAQIDSIQLIPISIASPVTYACSGTAPESTNAVVGPGTYVSGYNPTAWTYSQSASTSTPCLWRCSAGFIQNASRCILPQVISNSTNGTDIGRSGNSNKTHIKKPRTDRTLAVVYSPLTSQLDSQINASAITVEGESDSTAYAIINNFNPGVSKEIYLEKKNPNSNGVCVADRDNVVDINDLLSDCIKIKCPGNSGIYSCEFTNNTYIISGLMHSAAIETEIVDTPSPQNSGSGGGGSSSGNNNQGEIIPLGECKSNMQCSYTQCIDGKQLKQCWDVNSCVSSTQEAVECGSEIGERNEEVAVFGGESPKSKNYTYLIVYGFLALVFIGIAIVVGMLIRLIRKVN